MCYVPVLELPLLPRKLLVTDLRCEDMASSLWCIASAYLRHFVSLDGWWWESMDTYSSL